ncbi:PREDICTED: alpha-2-macroglobulin-P-like [Cyprinodon variegatus]|uniref:alpha-2-macroglobulin-P-like n=1 Tax=Cyprinodon variegatus TaxID=28743 RepID=UPI000742693C|nr:PREDICTED: alpha-2-macroglobulin-P-like [Cyprinodon variegatus]
MFEVEVRGNTFNSKEVRKVMIKVYRPVHLIQTDKPIYLPGQTVQFRVVSMDSKLRPINQLYSFIELEDSHRNRIGQWFNQASNSKILQLSYPLNSEAREGIYKINVKVGRDTSSHTFKVEKYTYGQPVQGNITVKVSPLRVKAVHYNNTPIPHMPLYLFGGKIWSIRLLQNLTTDSNGFTTFSVSTDTFVGDTHLIISSTPEMPDPQYRTAHIAWQHQTVRQSRPPSVDIKTSSVLKIKKIHPALPCDKEVDISIDYTVVHEPQGSVDIVHLFFTEKCFRNKVSLELSPSPAVPGEEIKLQLMAQPDSLCGISAVDQSVLIKEPGKTLDKEKIFAMLPVKKISHIPYQVQDPKECRTYVLPQPGTVFQNVGLKTATNLVMRLPICLRSRERYYDRGHRVPMSGRVNVGSAGRGPVMEPEPVKTVRTFFPETWIWDLVETGSNEPQVKVIAEQSSDYTLTPLSGDQYTSCLCANERKTLSWTMTATALGEALTEETELQLPQNVIEGSGRTSVSVLGDILGRALQNLDGLLQMPYGCGEQNMALLAPNIYILEYLQRSQQLTSAIKEKASNFLTSGYQRQLNYKDKEGGYSTFGSGPGNTWLTAFVLRSFSKAQSFVYIDPEKLEQSRTWLIKKQRRNGCFEKSGKLFNNRMKDAVVKRSLSCLRESVNDFSNIYTTALLAYVFTLAGDMETRAHLLQHLDSVATKDGGFTHWSQTAAETSASLSVEISSYVLLAKLSASHTTEDLGYAAGIVRWLTTQQNYYGGFSSTQETDTFMKVDQCLSHRFVDPSCRRFPWHSSSVNWGITSDP